MTTRQTTYIFILIFVGFSFFFLIPKSGLWASAAAVSIFVEAVFLILLWRKP